MGRWVQLRLVGPRSPRCTWISALGSVSFLSESCKECLSPAFWPAAAAAGLGKCPPLANSSPRSEWLSGTPAEKGAPRPPRHPGDLGGHMSSGTLGGCRISPSGGESLLPCVRRKPASGLSPHLRLRTPAASRAPPCGRALEPRPGSRPFTSRGSEEGKGSGDRNWAPGQRLRSPKESNHRGPAGSSGGV